MKPSDSETVGVEKEPVSVWMVNLTWFALPALLAIGLLHNTQKHFQLPNGDYGLDSLFLLLAFMSLARIKRIERLRYCAPGEGGNLLGLDRIPEVRTLRARCYNG